MLETRVVELLAQLVAIDTQNPPGREADAADFVADRLAGLGLAVETDALAPGRVNVIGRLDNGPGPVLVLNTHMDTVPAGDGWSSDPFVLDSRDGRLYGRGACDCKGPLAAMLEAVRLLAEARDGWSGTLLAVFVADEEVGSAGARRFAASGRPVDLAIVGEPTGNRPVIAHKGSLRPLLRVHGRTAHSGSPDSGENAILQAARLLACVPEAHARLRDRRHPLIGAASLTVTRIAGGHADNVVPDRCEALLDRRLVPGETEETALAEIRDMLEAAAAPAGIRWEIAECRPTTGGATEIAADHPLVAATIEACRRHGVADATPFGFGGACDLVHFRAMGAAGLVLGPGDLAVAHQPDEFVPWDELVKSVLIYRDAALAMLRR